MASENGSGAAAILEQLHAWGFRVMEEPCSEHQPRGEPLEQIHFWVPAAALSSLHASTFIQYTCLMRSYPEQAEKKKENSMSVLPPWLHMGVVHRK